MSGPRIAHADLFRSLTPEEFAALDTPESRARVDEEIRKAMEEVERMYLPPPMIPMPRWP